MGRFLKYLFRNRLDKDSLDFLIFFVTSRCQGRCRSCFFWRGINSDRDLSYSEITRILSTVGKFHTLLLSGGEPFLREELPEICSAFIEINGVKNIAIPTNGLSGQQMLRTVPRLLSENPGVSFSINFSLDGPEKIHDSIRNLPGSYRRATDTLLEITKLRQAHRNLNVVVNTVISTSNIDYLGDFMREVREQFDLDDHAFELLRGDPMDETMRLPSQKIVRKLHRQITDNQLYYLRKNRKISFLDKYATLALLRYSQRTKETVLAGHHWPFPCLAGGKIGVIEPDGNVKLCELKEGIGNLRDTEYDFQKVWISEKAMGLRKNIERDGCSCTHICFINMSAGSSLKSILSLPWQGLMAWMGR